MSELQRIKQFFDSNHLRLSEGWLECCVNWCKSDCLPPNYTEQELQVKVYEQWILLDLTEVQVASLPRDISSKKKYTLTGTFCLQMMQIVDISKPKLWQIQRIRDTVGKNTEPENEFGKRVLLVTLTDGVQEIIGMEFKPISCLNLNLVPGIKIKIMGPVTVRNGRLMLESHHVKIMGGEVDKLRISNAAENILARSLGLPENSDPFVIDESLLTANMDILEESSRQGTQNVTRNYNNQNSNQSKKQCNISENRTNSSRGNLQISKKPSDPPSFEIDEELLQQLQNEDFEDEDLDFNKSNSIFNNKARTDKSVESKKIVRNCSSPDMFDDMQFDDDLLNEHLDHLNKSLNDPNKQSSKTVKMVAKIGVPSAGNKTEVLASSSNSNDDFFNNADLDAHLDQLDAEMREMPSSTQYHSRNRNEDRDRNNDRIANKEYAPRSINVDIPKNPGPVKASVFTIEKLKKLQPNIGKGKFKIMATFKEVVEKMTVDEETKQYKLVISVKDDKNELLLGVHSDLVSNWMELSVEDLISVKQLIYQKDMLATEKFKLALTNLREKLMHSNGVMEVEIIRGEKYPILISAERS